MAYRIDALPEPLAREVVLRELIRSAESGSGALPEGWRVTWLWQNKKGGIWREDDFQTTVRESRSQFLGLMGIRLRRDLRSISPSANIKRSIRRSTEHDPEEEEHEERAEERSEREAARKRRKRRTKKRRKR
jgi:hypothetical protein